MKTLWLLAAALVALTSLRAHAVHEKAIAEYVTIAKNQNVKARKVLDVLLILVKNNRAVTATEKRGHYAALKAVEVRLHVKPGDKNFERVVRKARDELAANHAAIDVAKVKFDPSKCTSVNDWGCMAGGRVWVTQPWINVKDKQCRADVLAHEFAHVRGRYHVWEKTGKRAKDYTPDESIIDPDQMAQLVGLLTVGTADHCK